MQLYKGYCRTVLPSLTTVYRARLAQDRLLPRTLLLLHLQACDVYAVFTLAVLCTMHYIYICSFR